MPTTRAASTPSRRAMRNEAINPGSQLQSSCNFFPQCSCFAQPGQGFHRRFIFPRYNERLTTSAAVRFPLLRLARSIPRAAAVFSLLWASVAPAMAQSASPPASPYAAPSSASRQPSKPADTRGAQQAVERGQRAEKAGDMEEAFRDYSEAAEKSPNDRGILLRQELARFALVQSHTQQAAREILS